MRKMRLTHQLWIVCRLTLSGAKVGIQFEVLVERGCHRFALNHPELIQQVDDVLPLGDHNSGWSSNYLDAKEVMVLLHVCHLKFAGEKGLDLVDVD